MPATRDLTETLLAIRVAKEHKLAIVVSHRSKSPNEVMEADIAFADALTMYERKGNVASARRLQAWRDRA